MSPACRKASAGRSAHPPLLVCSCLEPVWEEVHWLLVDVEEFHVYLACLMLPAMLRARIFALWRSMWRRLYQAFGGSFPVWLEMLSGSGLLATCPRRMHSPISRPEAEKEQVWTYRSGSTLSGGNIGLLIIELPNQAQAWQQGIPSAHFRVSAPPRPRPRIPLRQPRPGKSWHGSLTSASLVGSVTQVRSNAFSELVLQSCLR